MSIEWTEAKGEVLDIVRQMVNAYHPNLKMAKIGVVFRSETSSAGGYEVWAKTAKADAKTNALLEGAGADMIDFLIWIAEPAWKNLSTEQRQALVDHELCHCSGVEDAWRMRGHDFEEFGEIVERHGFWNRNLFSATGAFKKALQLDLGLDLTLKTKDGRVVAVPADLLALADNIAQKGVSEIDNLLGEASKIALESPTISITMLQRKLRIGYSRAARLIDQMEELGLIGPKDEKGQYEVLENPEETVSEKDRE